MEGDSGDTRSVIDEVHSWDIQGDQTEGESMVLLKESPMNLILGMSNQIKWKLKVGLLEASLMNFIPEISKEVKCKAEVVLLEVSFMNFLLRILNEIKWNIESGVTRSIIDEFHS